MLKPIDVLAREFSRLPGIGQKTAFKMALHIIEMDLGDVENFSKILLQAKKEIKICENCFSYCLESQNCFFCSDPYRDLSTVCVVEKAQDIFTFERGDYKGVYHVLNGLVSPLDGIGPEDINIFELINRTQIQNVKEVIIALSSGVEGDATTLYIAKLLSQKNIKVSRLARGVPAGASIDYLDDLTLSRAIEERQNISC